MATTPSRSWMGLTNTGLGGRVSKGSFVSFVGGSFVSFVGELAAEPRFVSGDAAHSRQLTIMWALHGFPSLATGGPADLSGRKGP